MKDNELKHYGVLGMKWGRRKEQYNTSEDHNRARELEKKHVSEMSNKELNDFNNRKRLEADYARNNQTKMQKTLLKVAAVAAALGVVSKFYQNSKSTVAAGAEIYDAYKNKSVNQLSLMDAVRDWSRNKK